jgi:hypothetical protein
MVLVFTLVVSIAVGVLFGLAPALQVSGINLMDELKAGGKMARTALLLRTFANLRAIDVGSQVEKVLTASVQLPVKKYRTPEQALGFCSPCQESGTTGPPS